MDEDALGLLEWLLDEREGARLSGELLLFNLLEDPFLIGLPEYLGLGLCEYLQLGLILLVLERPGVGLRE